MLSVCSKDPVQLGQMKGYEGGSGNNFAFTSLNVPVEVQMAYVKELRPDLKNLAVLVDNKNVSAVQTQAEPISAYARRHGIEVISAAVQNPATAREELSRIVPEAVRKMRMTDPDLSKSLFWLTGSTAVFTEIRTINQYADKVPVVSVVPEIVTSGRDTAVLDRHQLPEQCPPGRGLRRPDPARRGKAERPQRRHRVAARHLDQLPESARNRHARAVRVLRDSELRVRLRRPPGAQHHAKRAPQLIKHSRERPPRPPGRGRAFHWALRRARLDSGKTGS